jgi:hypothetical protein
MPEWSLHRRFARFPLVLPLQHRVPDRPHAEAAVGWTHNVSGGGACLELAGPLRPSASLGLQLHTPDGPIAAEARVLWTRSRLPAEGGILHGIAFTQLAPDQLETLRRLLLSLRPWWHTRGRLPVNLAVTCHVTHPPGPSLPGRVGNFSRGGLLLRLPVALLPFMDLEVILPTPTGSLRLTSTIAWVEPQEKRKSRTAIQHGVRFTHLDWPTSLSLARLLANPV